MKKQLKRWYQFLHPKRQALFLEYPVDLKPRYGYAQPAHPELLQILESQHPQIEGLLKASSAHFNTLGQWPSHSANPSQPYYQNHFLPGLDMLMLYTILGEYKPTQYVEVGSGNSTKVAYAAKRNLNLDMQILSIDPVPRAEIDELADEIIRMPFEKLPDLQKVLTLQANDVLFIDNSHRVLPNSDATVFFLEVLPYLKPGVIVQVHDIYIPYDYPQFMCDRFYSEQYMLMMALLTNPAKFEILSPNFYIYKQPTLHALTKAFWEQPNLKGVEQHGGSFWFRIRS